MTLIEKLKSEIIAGAQISKTNTIALYHWPLEDLCTAANEIRKHFCNNEFDVCTIINGKSGKCSENCKFCAQSSYHNTHIEEYPLLSASEIVNQAKYNKDQGVLRYSIVTSGKKLSEFEIDEMCVAIDEIRKTVDISICISFGLLDKMQYKKLKNAGVTRVHNNLETSKRYFPNICTTHDFEDKVNAIRSAQSVGLTVCSGGIMGLGETPEDRIDMAFALRKLGINSVPINILNPIPGTIFEKNEKLTNDQIRRIVAIYRFILPAASIRLAGGRGQLEDNGEACFLSGANAVITGDMLTTSGISVKTDIKLIKKLGYEVKLCNE